jgi:hypothetical protein
MRNDRSTPPRRLDRDREIERMRDALERHEYPRLHMMLMVALTGGCGFLASYVMLHYGVESIALRYPLALCVAYVVFLLLLWRWLRSRPDDYLDTPDAPDVGGDWQFPQRSGGGSGNHGDAPSSDLFNGVDVGDDFAIPLLVIGFVVIVAGASLWVVYAAPALLAELVFDGVLAAGLYRRLRRSETRHWLDTALRRTVLPFVLTLVALAAFGAIAHHVRPEAHSIGDLLHRRSTAEALP